MTDAEKTLRELLDKLLAELGYRDHEIKLKAITSGGGNFTSVLYLATVKNGNKEDLNLFAKVACIGEKMRAVMQAVKIYQTEGFVYNKLAKIYDELQVKHGVAEEHRFVFPKFYGCNSDIYQETIVLENLVARGYKTYDRFKSIDWDHASSAVETLAKFHALSFAYQKERPEEFDEVVKEYQFQTTDSGDELKSVWEKMLKQALDILKPEYQARVLKYFEEGGETLFQKYNNPIGNPVLIHADYRFSNLLFKRHEDKVETRVVDFQTLRAGCPVADLVYMVFMGSDEQFRAEHYDALVEHYYSNLELALNRLKLQATEVYPRERFDSDLKEILPYSVLLGVAVLPIVTVEAEQAPKWDGDADIQGFVVAPNDLYAERFRGIIADCVRWGVI